jgi:cytochrome c-type biogenesis protein CcmE
MGKGAQIAIATLAAFAGLVWLLTAASEGEGAFRYYTSVSEFEAAAGDGGRARDSRVHGFVADGSIDRRLHEGYVDFAITDESGAALPVRLRGVELPDLFRDGAEVVVEGRLEGARFTATRVLAKCPSKYEEAEAAAPEA